MVWPPAAPLSSLQSSFWWTCTTYTFLLAKERWMILSVPVYQQCWHLMSWSLQHSPSCSQQLTAAFIACLLLVTTEKPAPEVHFQSFSKKGSATAIWLRNSCIFRVWEIMTITAHSERGVWVSLHKKPGSPAHSQASTCSLQPCCSCPC